MSAAEDAAAVLAQVVELGSGNDREAELGAAVSRHVSGGPAVRGSRADPEVAAGLRSLGQQPTSSPLRFEVDVVELISHIGLDETLAVLDRLKERFG